MRFDSYAKVSIREDNGGSGCRGNERVSVGEGMSSEGMGPRIREDNGGTGVGAMRECHGGGDGGEGMGPRIREDNGGTGVGAMKKCQWGTGWAARG